MKGDQAAIEIIESAGEVLGELAAFVARRLFTEDDTFPFVLAGGVFNIGKLVLGPDPMRAQAAVSESAHSRRRDAAGRGRGQAGDENNELDA